MGAWGGKQKTQREIRKQNCAKRFFFFKKKEIENKIARSAFFFLKKKNEKKQVRGLGFKSLGITARQVGLAQLGFI